MRAIIILIISSIFFNYTAKAQSGFNAGFFGGITTTQVDGDNYTGYDKVGFTAGGLVNRKLSDKFSLQLEIIYAQKGSRHNPNPDVFDYTIYKMKLSYAELPILIKYHYKPILIFEAGPSFGKLLTSSEEDANGILNDQQDFRSFEFAGNIGVDVAIINNLRINWRFAHSLYPIRYSVDASNLLYVHGGQYNNVMSFTIRYMLDHSKNQN